MKNHPKHADQDHRSARPAHQRGFTLVEAVMSLAILGIIMATIGAATTVMVRLMPRAGDPRTVALAIGSALEQFESDTTAMVSIQTAEPDLLQITVNGLGTGGAPETVHYKFDIGEGHLLRAIGGDTLEPILAGITNATFDYALIERPHPELTEPEAVESRFGTTAVDCNDMVIAIESGTTIRQRLDPQFEEGTSAWRIESIRLRLKQHVLFSSGTCRVQFFRLNDDGTLAATAIRRIDIPISTLTSSLLSATTNTYTVSDMPWLDPDDNIAIVISAIGGSFRTHLATLSGHPSMEFYSFSDGSAAELTGFLLCFRLNGSAMEPGDQPAALELLQSITLEITHPTLPEPTTQYVRPTVPVVIQP